MTTAVTPASKPLPPEKPYTVRDLLRDKQQDIAAALPRHIPPSHFMRVVLTAVQRQPQLAQCTSLSFLGAVLQCAQLGLVPDGFLGQAYLIPYKNNKRQPPVFEVQFQIGYRGLVTLARRSGEVTSIGADVVYEKDHFRQLRGITPSVEHRPFDGEGDPGPLVYVYAWYRLRGGDVDLTVLNRREVHRIRDRSQAYRFGVSSGKKDSPWFTDESWMWRKTAIKQLLKLAPMSVELQRVSALDDAAEVGVPQDLQLLADPKADPTPLLEGDGIEDELDDAIEMPQRTDPPMPQVPPNREVREGDLKPAPSVAAAQTNGLLVDRITDTEAAGNCWKAITQGGLKLWTRDAALGEQLLAAKGTLRQIQADPADAQGRRKLLRLEA